MSEPLDAPAIVRLAAGDGWAEVEGTLPTVTPRTEPVGLLEWKRRDESWPDARWRLVGGARFRTVLEELENGVDYELRLRTESVDLSAKTESAIRLLRPAPVPGTVINTIHPADYTYNRSGRSPASPSLAILPDGRYIASHDVYWGLHGQCLTLLFQSADRGANWSFLTAIEPCFWGKLFVHRGDLYMLATATEYGALLIRRSTDGGATWSHPAEILPPGSRERGGPHKAPMPVLEHAGRLWSAVEHGSWSLGGHAAGVVSVPVDADLLDPAAWAATPFLPYDPAWPGTVRGGDKPGVLEGNVVVTPAGELVNVLRYNTRGGDPPYGRAIVLEVAAGDPRAPLRFRQVIDFPGNMSKFTIRHDPVSGRYWSLVNRVTSPNVSQRNILTLTHSQDLVHWEIAADILNYEANGWPEDLTKVGFQYVDWLFDGDDLIAASRTALGGAHNYHNANHLTFHRIRDFRAL